jgi:cell fate (sporulation/competence/biofilm development) regulator YmcA (YheA/YmcA/DUF963 family)
MNRFTQLLRKSVDEIKEYQRTSTNAALYGDNWFELLIQRIELASELNDQEVDKQLDAITYTLIDSGPLTENFTPSFEQIMDALQRQRKKIGKKK